VQGLEHLPGRRVARRRDEGHGRVVDQVRAGGGELEPDDLGRVDVHGLVQVALDLVEGQAQALLHVGLRAARADHGQRGGHGDEEHGEKHDHDPQGDQELDEREGVAAVGPPRGPEAARQAPPGGEQAAAANHWGPPPRPRRAAGECRCPARRACAASSPRCRPEEHQVLADAVLAVQVGVEGHHETIVRSSGHQLRSWTGVQYGLPLIVTSFIGGLVLSLVEFSSRRFW